MEQRELEKGMNGRDALDRDNEGGEVTALLSALPRVEAPGNFEFGVRARIAARQQVKPTNSLVVPFLRLAAPLALLLLVMAAVFFYGTMLSTDTPIVVVDTRRSESPASSTTEVASDVPHQQVSGPQVTDPEGSKGALTDARTAGPVRVSNNSEPRRDRRSGSIEAPVGGSVDRTLRSANTILPKGFESPNLGRQNSNTNAGTAETPVSEVLQILGITADPVNGGWRVRAAAANSTSERVGVRAGDVIETIDGKALTRTTTFRGQVSVKTIGIRRDGKSINLTLGN